MGKGVWEGFRDHNAQTAAELKAERSSRRVNSDDQHEVVQLAKDFAKVAIPLWLVFNVPKVFRIFRRGNKKSGAAPAPVKQNEEEIRRAREEALRQMQAQMQMRQREAAMAAEMQRKAAEQAAAAKAAAAAAAAAAKPAAPAPAPARGLGSGGLARRPAAPAAAAAPADAAQKAAAAPAAKGLGGAGLAVKKPAAAASPAAAPSEAAAPAAAPITPPVAAKGLGGSGLKPKPAGMGAGSPAGLGGSGGLPSKPAGLGGSPGLLRKPVVQVPEPVEPAFAAAAAATVAAIPPESAATSSEPREADEADAPADSAHANGTSTPPAAPGTSSPKSPGSPSPAMSIKPVQPGSGPPSGASTPLPQSPAPAFFQPSTAFERLGAGISPRSPSGSPMRPRSRGLAHAAAVAAAARRGERVPSPHTATRAQTGDLAAQPDDDDEYETDSGDDEADAEDDTAEAGAGEQRDGDDHGDDIADAFEEDVDAVEHDQLPPAPPPPAAAAPAAAAAAAAAPRPAAPAPAAPAPAVPSTAPVRGGSSDLTSSTASPSVPEPDKWTFTGATAEIVPLPDNSGLLVLRKMSANNSCLFNAVDYAKYGQKTSGAYSTRDHAADDGGMHLRLVVANEVEDDPVKYSGAFLGMENRSYVRWIQQPANWGGGIELSILAKHFKMEIGAWNIESGHCHVFGEESGYKERVLVIYDGKHYDAIAVTPSLNAPAMQDQTKFDPHSSRGRMIMAAAQKMVELQAHRKRVSFG